MYDVIFNKIYCQISNPKGKIKEVKVLRRRRQTTTEEQEFLDAHNEARFKVVPKAANMKKIVSQLQSVLLLQIKSSKKMNYTSYFNMWYNLLSRKLFLQF